MTTAATEPSKRKYLPQFTRLEDEKPPFKLQTRDVQILRAVYENRFMTADLLNQLFPPDPERTPAHKRTANPTDPGANLKKRLQKLFHHGLLARIKTYIGEEHIYALDQAGADELLDAKNKGTLTIDLEHRYDWKEKSLNSSRIYQDHTLMLSRFHVALRVAARAHPRVNLVHYERESKGLKVKWESGNKKPYINPDAFLVLRDTSQPTGKQTYAYFVEIDRSTMPMDRMLEKFTQYSLFLTEERQKEAFEGLGTTPFRILTVTDTEKRAQKLLELLGEPDAKLPKNSTIPKGYRIPAKHLEKFYFTPEETYLENPAYALARSFRTPENFDVPRALIPSPFLAQIHNALAPRKKGELLTHLMADKKSEPKKEAFLIRSLTLTPATEKILKSLSSDASDFTGRTISASAILRALLLYAGEQPYSWLTEKLFPFVENELTSGRTWGKKKQ